MSHSFYLHCLPISNKILYAYYFDLIATSDACSYISQLIAKMDADVAYIIVFTDYCNSNTVKCAQYIGILRDEAAQQTRNQRKSAKFKLYGVHCFSDSLSNRWTSLCYSKIVTNRYS